VNLFGWGKNKKHYAIALDIGTEFVKVLVFRLEDNKAFVVGVGKQRQGLTDMQGGHVTDIAGVSANCEKALEQAFQMAGVAPEQCVIGIAGELVKGATTTVHYHRADPDKNITLEELKNIIGQVQEKSFEKTRADLAWETGQEEPNVKLVNSAIVDVKIDGFKVNNPVGFQGKDVEVGIYNSFAPVLHLSALQTVAENLGLDLLAVAAEPYAVARCVGMDDSADFSSIFIDIGGGTTDIAVVRSGGLDGTKMFAIGGRVFTKAIADALELTFADAERLKLKYSQGEIEDEKEQKKVSDALENVSDVWLSGVELALEEFNQVDLLPSKIMLCGGGSLLPEIKDYLEKREWSKRLPFAKHPKIDFVSPEHVSTVVDEVGKLSGAQDITPMGLANLAIDLAGEEGVVGSIMDKITDGLRR